MGETTAEEFDLGSVFFGYAVGGGEKGCCVVLNQRGKRMSWFVQ